MKKLKLKLAMAALMTCGMLSAQAADNAFSDVTPDDWAYQSVQELSKEGVIDGYPDGSFKGDRNLTRYEMAQITGRLLAKEDTLTKEQRAKVDELATEYVDQLNNLGVRVSKLEDKTFADTTWLLEMRTHYMPVYDNIYKSEKESHDQFGTRFRLDTFTHLTDRLWMYSQMQTLMSMGNGDYTDNNADADDDSKFRINRLFTTYHFGGLKDHYQFNKGPTDNNLVLGRFVMRMGVTGYTYDGAFTGAMAEFGDHYEGGHFDIGYGRANDINYDYTKPMMSGLKNMKSMFADLAASRSVADGLIDASTAETLKAIINSATSKEDLYAKLTAALTQQGQYTAYTKVYAAALAAGATAAQAQAQASAYVAANSDTIASSVNSMLSTVFSENEDLINNMDWSTGTYYPMWDKGVHMADGEDSDVPVTFLAYVYNKPKRYTFHAYWLKVNGPVDAIAKAYGAALGFNVNDNLSFYGEYVKNMRKLPLNNERPYSLTLGVRYGEADILKPHSYSISLDHVYSQAGTYFGGSSSDVADQYMGHVYSDWHGQGRTPAYIADKIDAIADGTDSPEKNYGGAKFYLAKIQYVPIRGLKLQAEYGFKAEDMGGHEMDDMIRLEASAYFM
jgi:hypothetical protein